MSNIKSPLSLTLFGMFDTKSFLDKFIARAMASLGDMGGGGLDDRIVRFHAVASSLLIWRGPFSLEFSGMENSPLAEGSISSVFERGSCRPDQSPDLGRFSE